jgi:hypothetical protein
MVISPIDFPVVQVSDVSENQVVLSKLLSITAPVREPLENFFDFFKKTSFGVLNVTKALKVLKSRFFY